MHPISLQKWKGERRRKRKRALIGLLVSQIATYVAPKRANKENLYFDSQ